MHIHRVLSLVIIMTIATSNLAIAECAALSAGSSAEGLIGFLRASKKLQAGRQDQECIQFALEHLAYKPSPDATAVLVDYLGFERPLSDAERDGFMFHGPRSNIAGYYAASSTLFTFGRSAIPALVSAIETRESSVVRHNATYTVMQIFRRQPVDGIQTLKQELAKLPLGKAATNVKNAIQEAIRWCDEGHQKECESAAAER